MRRSIIQLCFSVLLISAVSLVSAGSLRAQARGGNTLYGDVRVEESKDDSTRLVSIEITLYNLAAYVVARQVISNNGRYRFINLVEGEYDLVVSIENSEVSRMRIQVRTGPSFSIDIRQDITLAWKSAPKGPTKPASVFPEDFYKRTPANEKLFEKAQEATDKKKFDESIGLLKQLVANDPKDFQAWTELGTVYLLEKNLADAEKAYEQSTQVRPTFFLALMNLGRLRLMEQKFDSAIPVLTKALELKANSADANYYLGEAYLQIKKGSKAVGYFYEALKLDPVGKAEAHLRLAALYNGAGMKDKAALEYVEFLKKKPDYPDKKKLEEYIARNKK
jgi:cytochrome c-type biogenesis protein CcmH/NrfG